MVAGPYNAQFRELVESSIYFDKFSEALLNTKSKSIAIAVNSKEISKAVGANKLNIMRIENLYDIKLKIIGDDNLKIGDFYLLEK